MYISFRYILNQSFVAKLIRGRGRGQCVHDIQLSLMCLVFFCIVSFLFVNHLLASYYGLNYYYQTNLSEVICEACKLISIKMFFFILFTERPWI